MQAAPTIELLFPGVSDEPAEILIAQLSLLGYDSFWESEEGLRAYIAQAAYDEAAVSEIALSMGVTFQLQAASVAEWTPAQDDIHAPIWLAHGRVYIYSEGQPLAPEAEFALHVDRKLSFGSGHHPSTAMCVEWMLDQPWHDEPVVDAGTGSGILALLVERLTTGPVYAFDNNPWAIEVAEHNAACNQSRVQWAVADPFTYSFEKPFPRVLANLNADVFRSSMAPLATLVAPKGQIILSGYTEENREEVDGLAQSQGLLKVEERQSAEWLASVWTR